MNAQFFINEIGCNFNLRKPKSEKPTNVYFVARVNENNTIVNEKINKLKLYFSEYKQYLCDHPKEIEHRAIILLKKYIYKDTMKKKRRNQLPSS